MQNAHVDSLDLRSLRLLAKLLDCGSVTLAGEAFGLSQPAASRAVARLRRALGDPLLARASHGYVLTPRAQEIRRLLARTQAELDQLFLAPTFDPAASTRKFRLASTDYGVLIAAPPALRRLSQAAPQISLIITPWTDDTLARLESGELDAALYVDTPLPPDFHMRPLFEDGYAILFDPAVNARRDVEAEPSAFRRVVLLYPDGSRLVADDPLGDLGHAEEAVALAVPYFATMTAAIKGTPLIAAAPRRIAERLKADSGLAYVIEPTIRHRFQYRLIWHRRTHLDAAMIWFRAEFAAAAGDTPLSSS